MQRPEAHVFFLDTIGLGDWFYGTTLNDVRYCVEGDSLFMGGEPAYPAKVVLHFPACKGGDVVEGYGIYNYLRGLAAKGVAIEARVEGLCASIATLIALAADTVEMAEAALWMVHKPSSSGGGNADELRAEADILDKIQAQLVGRYVARTGMDAATANELINKTSWLNADECLALGFITGKLADAPLVAPVGTEAVLNYFPTTKQPAAMAITAAEKKTFFDELKAEIKGFFKNEAEAPAPTNMTMYKVDVEGGDPMYTDISDDGIEGLDVADMVYSDEAMTTAYPDGEYTLTDGRTATITAGAVEELDQADTTAQAEAAATNAAELEALRAENAVLKAENAAAALKVTGLTNRLKSVPGSAGNPTKPGAAQQVAPKPGATNAAAPAFTIRKV